MYTYRLVTALAFGVLLLLPGLASARVIHEERSLYQSIIVTKVGRRVCLQFTLKGTRRNQSCVDQRNSKRMVFDYTQMMMAVLLFHESPRRILIVGLGGGTLPMALSELLPEAQIDSVEIDAAVVRVAKEYFGYSETPRRRTIIQDARVFTKRAVRQGARYDLIVLDAFNGDYIPEHLMTLEYLEENRALLTDGGVLAANTFSISKLYDHESVTYQRAFGTFVNFRLPSTANRLIIATKGPLPGDAELKRRAEKWRPVLAPYDAPVHRYLKRFEITPDWDVTARPLTDQYVPANILRRQ